jgi:hypothetical protein
VEAKAGVRVLAAADANEVLGLSQQTVFRTEQRRQADAGRHGEQVRGVTELLIYRRRVGDQADAAAAEGSEGLLPQHLQAGADRWVR